MSPPPPVPPDRTDPHPAIVVVVSALAVVLAVAACLVRLAEGETVAFSIGAAIGSVIFPGLAALVVALLTKARTATNASLLVFAGVALFQFLVGLAA